MPPIAHCRAAVWRCLVALLLSAEALALDPAAVARVRAGQDCVQCDLRDADSSNVDLREADLDGARFARAHLRVAKLPAALAGVDFCMATMPDGQVNHGACRD